MFLQRGEFGIDSSAELLTQYPVSCTFESYTGADWQWF
jgi:hypothetical protein